MLLRTYNNFSIHLDTPNQNIETFFIENKVIIYSINFENTRISDTCKE